MLEIMRKYTIGVFPRWVSDIEDKLKELNVSIQKTDYYRTTILGKEIGKVYFDCMSDEDTMDNLIKYLQLSFEGRASIIY